MSLLHKSIEASKKQAKSLSQMKEISYRALNGTRQTRSNFINNDLKEQSVYNKPAVGSLTSEMIRQYKRDEEENNKYVDSTGKEFLYNPTNLTPPVLKAPTLNNVTSLGAPATLTDVQTEQGNYDKKFTDLHIKKQEIQDKIQDVKVKQRERKSKEDEKKKAFDESTELTKEESDRTTKLTNDQTTLATLIAITNPSAKEKKKMKDLNFTIPKLETRVKALPALIAAATAESKQFEKDGKALEADLKTILTDIKTIQTVDIPKIEKDLENVRKLIEIYQDNIQANEIIERDTERENKQETKTYQDTFNIMNKNRYQVTQGPTETDADFIKRINSLELLELDPNIFKDRAATEGNKKLMINLKDIIARDENKISEIVKLFSSPEEVFLINSNWSIISNLLKRQFGIDNKNVTANEYKSEIEEALDTLQSGKTTNITVVAPPATGTIPAPSATPGTSGPAAATTTPLANDIPDDKGAASGYYYEEDDDSLVISNPTGDIVYIKIAISKTLKKILFSKTDNNAGSFKAFNFNSATGEISFKKFKTDFFGKNTFVYNQMFGSDINYIKMYDHLKSNFSLTDINRGDLKQIPYEGKTIIGYGLKTQDIPDICHFGKNIILLKKLYYNNILSVKNKKMHAIEYFSNVKVSDNFADVILQMSKNSKPNINNLKQDEKKLLDTLLHICGIKSSTNSSSKDDVVNELKKQLKLAEGELRAGNNNPLVKEELKDMLKKLTLYNVVTLKNSKDYLKQF